ncbi:MAG: T9SS type A sorting domain-containing protein [Bacteroidetes bacterium]|nr:T9SS type A sorting domain-containing protein [Bacteroidota bacterium]
MYRKIILFISTFAFINFNYSQIKVSSALQTYDSINNGELIYYQFSWDDPIDDYPEFFPLAKPLKAFETIWDTMVVSDGALFFISSKKSNSLLVVDGIGWDLMDKGHYDTVDFPNISPIIVSPEYNSVEWRGFGFANELFEIDTFESTGNLIIKVDSNNKVHITFGDFTIARPDLCFEDFGGLRPSVTYIDELDNETTWFVFGDPKSPAIDTLSDTAFSALPDIGRTLTFDFSKTNFISKQKISKAKIYPNPASEKLYISGISNSQFEFSIISFNGKTVKKGISENNTIDIFDLKTGNYIIKIKDKNTVHYSKFIKI